MCLLKTSGIYENIIPFNVAISHFHFNMPRLIGAYGREWKPPSMHNLRIWILNEELNSTKKDIQEILGTWSQTTIMVMFNE